MASKTRVLVVDDSAFARSIIAKKLNCEELEIIDFAKDGVEALEKTKELRPDVVTLDVSMPRMDGLEALDRIMEECPTPVVMLSSLTGEQTKTTLSALEKGAVDFFLKPNITSAAGAEDIAVELRNIIKAASTVSGARLRNAGSWARRRDMAAKPNAKPKAQAQRGGRINKLVVLGTSTGGPKALAELIPALPGDLPACILMVQHMPPVFTKSLAERLDQSSEIHVREAQEGDRVEAGTILLAPGGHHMTLTKNGTIALNQEPQVCGVRPAVDVTMKSVAPLYRASTLGVVLTGMGADGTQGAASIKAAGGTVIVEDESTCAIYGMPKSIVDAGYADQVVPLHKMARKIAALCAGKTTGVRSTASVA